MDRKDFIENFSSNNPQKTDEAILGDCFPVISNYFGSLDSSLSEKNTDPDTYQLYQYHGGFFFKTASLKMEFELKENFIEVKKNDHEYDRYVPKDNAVFSEKHKEEVTFDFFDRYLPLFMN